MPRGGGGMVGSYWNVTTESWFEPKPQMFLPFPYAGMDFCGNPKTGLPPGYVWGLVVYLYVFCISLSIYVYKCIYDDTDIVFVTLVDVGEVGRHVA